MPIPFQSTIPFQPDLPAEVAYTDAERAFLEESPPGLLPENQDSNFGFLIRKVWTDQMQEVADQMTTMYAEAFIQTSTDLLEDWEIDLGLPVNPENLSLAQRRSVALGRVRTGAFTRQMRNGIIEEFIIATFGTVIEFTSTGVPFVSTGIPFHAEAGSVATLYNVIEDLPNFTYEVRIKDTIAPDEAALRRALDRVTPAGISYTIVYVATP